MKRFTVTTPAKTHAQATKLDKRRQAVQSLVDRYNNDPEFGETMAHLTGALYLAIACADNCTWEMDKLTTNILIPAELRKCIKDMTTCMQRTIRAEERNKLLACTPQHFEDLADDGRQIMELLNAISGMQYTNFTKVKAYAINLSNQEKTTSKTA